MKKLFMLLIICQFSIVAFADTYYVEPVSGSATSSEGGLGDVLSTVIKNEVVQLGHRVVENSEGGLWVLRPSLHTLGSFYILSLSKSQNGEIVFSEKLKTQKQGDLDVLSERLVRAAVKNQRATRVETVNLQEKQEVYRQAFFGFGTGYLSGLKADRSGFAWTLGYVWGLDPQFALRLSLEGLNASDSGADVTALGLGGQYYLNNLKHSPYVLGLVGHSWADSEDAGRCSSCTGDFEHGWAMSLGAGMHFYRNSAVNLALELSYGHGLYDVVDNNPGMTSLKFLVFW